MFQNITSKLPSLPLSNKRILLRIDGNVPIDSHGIIQDDFRLQRVRKTIDFILLQNAQIFLLTHIGRPKKKENKLSTFIIYQWFKAIGYHVIFVKTITEAKKVSFHKQQLIIIENIRFFKGEQSNSLSFAKKLASLGTYYINDAFGSLHRYDTSIVTVAKLFSLQHKSIGFLVENELQNLKKLHTKSYKPFIALVGGGKVTTKLPLLKNLVAYADTMIVLPALSLSFEYAKGNIIKTSTIHQDALTLCNVIYKQAKKYNTKIILPSDYQVAHKTIEGTLSYKTIKECTNKDIPIAIGPKTFAVIKKEIKTAESIFFNGSMGFSHLPKTEYHSQELLQLISKSDAFTIIAGGDTTRLANKINSIKNSNYISTGGGATLTFLAGKTLPGLQAIQEK